MLGFFMKIFMFKMIDGNVYLKYNGTLQQGTHKIGFECLTYVNAFRISNHHSNNPNIFASQYNALYSIQCCLHSWTPC